MTRDELIELLTENYSPDEEVTFVYEDDEWCECRTTAASIGTIEEVHSNGHFEIHYAPKSGRYCNLEWVQDSPREVIKKKVLRIGE